MIIQYHRKIKKTYFADFLWKACFAPKDFRLFTLDWASETRFLQEKKFFLNFFLKNFFTLNFGKFLGEYFLIDFFYAFFFSDFEYHPPFIKNQGSEWMIYYKNQKNLKRDDHKKWMIIVRRHSKRFREFIFLNGRKLKKSWKKMPLILNRHFF